MSDSSRFDIFKSEIGPRTLIEANAGSGKTYTLAGLFVRLLIERAERPEQILVVTFTNKAAKELKDRIYNILNHVQELLESARDPDGEQKEFEEDLLEKYRLRGNPGKREETISRIREARRNMDEVRITTIHGFCQRLLQERTLETGVPFDPEVDGSDDRLIEAAADFWREFVGRHSGSTAGRYLIAHLLRMAGNPSELVTLLKPALRNPDAPQVRKGGSDPFPLLAELADLRAEMRGLWEKRKKDLHDKIVHSDVKSAEHHLPGRSAKMELFLNEENFESDTFDQLQYFTTSWFGSNLRKQGNRIPDDSFFDLCDRYLELVEEIPGVETWLLGHCFDSVKERYRELCRGSRRLSYDDLLRLVREALERPEEGERLALAIRRQFPVALVDEFQDTDPEQFRIFDRIYPKEDSQSSLVMIGDPKQSIYAFRGADLYIYLAARQSVKPGFRYTLGRNFRSRPGIVDAVNKLFSPGHGTPFLDDKIAYLKSTCAGKVPEDGMWVDGRPPEPVLVTQLAENGGAGSSRVSLLLETVRQVCDLVRMGRSGRAVLLREDGSRTGVEEGDIAILVHKHSDGAIIRKALKRAGVLSVTYTRESIFDTPEAESVARLFAAVLDPSDPVRVQDLFATGFFGNRISEFRRRLGNEEERSRLVECLIGLHEVWETSGCFVMIRKLLFDYGALETVSRTDERERILTNLQQLAELLSELEREQQLDPSALFRWLSGRLGNSHGGDAGDEEILRLESDSGRVRILTLHNSKGLQFPVVFAPTVALENAAPSNRRRWIVPVHRPRSPRELELRMDQHATEERAEALRRADFESISEEVRKCYVAITRARYHCRLFWTPTRTGHLSGFAALLRGPEQVREDLRSKRKYGSSKKAPPLSDLTSEIEAAVPGVIGWKEADNASRDVVGDRLSRSVASLESRIYRGVQPLIPAASRHNFTSLTRTSSSRHPEPDYDSIADRGMPADTESGRFDLFRFPRGKRAGTLIHRLFEHPEFDFRSSNNFERIASDTLRAFGEEEEWAPALAEMMEAVAGADYGELKLNRVAPGEKVCEMEFCLPVSEPQKNTLLSAIRKESEKTGRRGEADGFLNGFIDLVVRQNGRYYLIDYKSNHLGETLREYAPDNLEEEMRRADYDLQYHLYLVALKRYLEKRDPGFRFEEEFGGVFYLFVRGMEKGSRSGIYVDHPSPALIESLEMELSRAG